MNTFLKPFLSLLIVFGLMSFEGSDPILCDAKILKEKAEDLLNPFKYDSSELTRILYKNTESVKEVEVPLFIGEKYKIVFVTEALPKGVEIQIYNKDKESKNRKLLFSYKDASSEKENIQFEISKSRHVFVDYIIPPVEEGSFSGCVVFAVGYK